MFQLLTIFLSGAFGLLVVVIGNWMVSSKESRQHKREKAQARYEEMKTLYSEHLATFHLITTHRANHLDETPFVVAYSTENARLLLLSVPSVIEHSERMSEVIEQWGREYNAGYPPGMTIGHGGEHRKTAADLSKEIDQQRAKLIEVMRAHLDTLRASI